MKKLLLIILFFGVFSVSAQSLTPSVNGSSGGQFSIPTGSLDWMLGEIMTETYQQNSYYLTQGFHQPAIIIVTDVVEKPGLDMSLYPNPVREFLTVKISLPGDYEIDLFDLKGVMLVSHKLQVKENPEEQEINMQELAVALYVLRVTDVALKKTYGYRIEKVMKE